MPASSPQIDVLLQAEPPQRQPTSPTATSRLVDQLHAHEVLDLPVDLVEDLDRQLLLESVGPAILTSFLL